MISPTEHISTLRMTIKSWELTVRDSRNLEYAKNKKQNFLSHSIWMGFTTENSSILQGKKYLFDLLLYSAGGGVMGVNLKQGIGIRL